MTRIVLITAALLIALAAGSVGALAWADGSASGKLPAGTRVGGVDVGGLTQQEAVERAQNRVEASISRPTFVQLGEKRYTLTPADAGVTIDVETAVKRAYVDSREGSFLSRGWREITGAKVRRTSPSRPSPTVSRSVASSRASRRSSRAPPSTRHWTSSSRASASRAAGPDDASPPATRSSPGSCAA